MQELLFRRRDLTGRHVNDEEVNLKELRVKARLASAPEPPRKIATSMSVLGNPHKPLRMQHDGTLRGASAGRDARGAAWRRVPEASCGVPWFNRSKKFEIK